MIPVDAVNLPINLQHFSPALAIGRILSIDSRRIVLSGCSRYNFFAGWDVLGPRGGEIVSSGVMRFIGTFVALLDKADKEQDIPPATVDREKLIAKILDYDTVTARRVLATCWRLLNYSPAATTGEHVIFVDVPLHTSERLDTFFLWMAAR